MLVIQGLHASESTSGGRAYLLEAPMECVLIDTGAPDGTLGVGHLIGTARRPLHEVRLILLTHAHRGHAGNAAELRRLTGARLAASAEAARLLQTPGGASPGGGLPFRRRQPWPPEPIRVDDILEPGQELQVAGGIKVLDAPGHAPGALAFHCYGPNALVTGDAVTVERRTGRMVAPARRHCAYAATAAETARSLAAVGARVIAPGHGWPTVDGRLPGRQWGAH